jgi:DNA-binding transcriptional LysR family regulator
MERAALAAAGASTGSDGTPAGFLRVSVSEGFGSWILGRHLHEFHAKYPMLTVDLVASGGFLSPTKREAEVAVMLARPARGPLIVRRLAEYRLGLYAAEEYLQRRGAPSSIGALVDHTLVGFVPDLIQVPEQRLFEELGSNLAPTLRSTSINAQASLVGAGAGIGLLPRFVGAQLPGVVPVLEDVVTLRRGFWLVVHEDLRRSARIDAFIRWLDDIVQRNAQLIKGGG